ncbi:hypothetical protein M0R01_03915 [bacterium]|nr:hypothetical protein [bacterium]
MDNIAKIIGAIAIAFFVIFLISCIACPFIYLLWNWIMPTLFGLNHITLAQAWGLNILCGILFNKQRLSSKN